MFWSGLAVVVGLTFLAFAAAVAVGVRARFAGRAELACAVTVGWSALILAPIYALGFTSTLTARTLGLGSLVLSGATLYVAARGRWGEVGRAIWGLARLPTDALVVTWRARSFAFVGVVIAFVMLAWVTWCVYFVPSYRGWDALWYHEPIVGFTIQNHGLSVIHAPAGMQKVNGYPKAAELTALWFTIFTDRRLIDLASCFALPAMILAMYTLARRYSESQSAAIGWAVGLGMMPAAAQELQSTYVDVNFAWAILVTVVFALRPVFRVRDGLYTAVAATILLGTKAHALMPTPILLFTALYRLMDRNRGRGRDITLVALFATVLVTAMVGSVYLRSWVVFHNPFWPDMKVDLDKWHIHWPGNFEAGERVASRDGMDMNEDWSQLASDATSEPYSWHRWHYGEIHDFGWVVGWVIAPLGSLMCLVLLFAVVRDWLGSAMRIPGWSVSNETKNAALLVLPLVLMIALSPARWSARYNIATTGLGMALIAWASGRRGFSRLGEGLSAVAILSGLTCNAWANRWWLWPSELTTLARIPYPEREVTTSAKFTGAYHMTFSGANTATGVARERELKKDSVVVFPDSYGNYVALLWNNSFSNKIVWVPEGDDFIANAEKLDPTWIYVTFGDPNYSRLKAAGSKWEEVGPLNDEGWGAPFRRKK